MRASGGPSVCRSARPQCSRCGVVCLYLVGTAAAAGSSRCLGASAAAAAAGSSQKWTSRHSARCTFINCCICLEREEGDSWIRYSPAEQHADLRQRILRMQTSSASEENSTSHELCSLSPHTGIEGGPGKDWLAPRVGSPAARHGKGAAGLGAQPGACSCDLLSLSFCRGLFAKGMIGCDSCLKSPATAPTTFRPDCHRNSAVKTHCYVPQLQDKLKRALPWQYWSQAETEWGTGATIGKSSGRSV